MISITTIDNFRQQEENNKKRIYYIGHSYEKLKETKNLLSIAQEVDNLFSSYKKDILNLDQYIEQTLSPLWLASDLAENNMCLEATTLYIVKTMAVINKMKSSLEDFILVCDNDIQMYIYYNLLKDNGIKCSKTSIKYIKILRHFTGKAIAKICGMLNTIYKIIYLKFYRYRKKIPASKKTLSQSDLIVVNWVTSDSLMSNNLFDKDKYFGRLISFLKQRGLRVRVIGKMVDFSQSFKEIISNLPPSNTNDQILLLYDFIRIRDLLKAFFWSFLFLRYRNTKYFIGGKDFKSLFNFLCLEEALKPRIPHALETYYFINRIKKLNLSKDTTFLYPYENQPWEKILSFSLKSAMNIKKIFAYGYSSFSKNYLTCFFSKKYSQSGFQPQLLLSNTYSQSYFDAYDTKQQLAVGNFQFENLSTNQKSDKKFSPHKKQILCSCSIQLDDSLELVDKTLSVITELSNELKRLITIIINFHPLMGHGERKKIKSLTQKLNSINIVLADQKSEDLLDHVDLLLYNSNSVCFYAASRGIPVVFVQSDVQIDLDRMPEASSKFRTVNEGVKLLTELLTNEQFYNDNSIKCKEYYNSYYIEPDYEKIYKILNHGDQNVSK